MTLQAELQLLRGTRRLISNPDRWCQGSFSKEATTLQPRAVTRFGFLKRIEVVEVPTTAYCLAGAMSFCDHGEIGGAWNIFSPLQCLRRRIAGHIGNPIPPIYGEGPIIHSFNDSHTHAEVIALLDEIEQEILDEIEREEILELAAIINESEPEYELVS